MHASIGEYVVTATDQDGIPIFDGQVAARTLESAWAKAVKEAFFACPSGTGSRPHAITVFRKFDAQNYQD